MSELESLTGNETIDSLQSLQRVVNVSADNFDVKMDRVRGALEIIRAADLLGREFMISTSLALGKILGGNGKERYMYRGGFFFTAQLDGFAYLFDRDVPIDSLSCNFTSPTVFEASSEKDLEAFQRLELQVPVLAIDACISLEAA